MSVQVETAAQLRVGAPATLFDVGEFQPNHDSYAPSRDGQRFLVLRPVNAALPSPVHLVFNWHGPINDADAGVDFRIHLIDVPCTAGRLKMVNSHPLHVNSLPPRILPVQGLVRDDTGMGLALTCPAIFGPAEA
jgi:hypothetical protein